VEGASNHSGVVDDGSFNRFRWVNAGPALGMFELFDRTGPPILGGRLFGR